MKYLRLFENINKPKRGDYVLIDAYSSDILRRYNVEYLEFIGNSIGRIINISNKDDDSDGVAVEFDKAWIPPDSFNVAKTHISTSPDIGFFKISDIEFFSPNMEDIKYRLEAKKYNL